MAEPQLAGQTVVVLGGSAGIGLATARRARAEGANVVITGRDPERLARAAADVGATQTAHFDAADEPALQQFFDQLGRQLDGPIGHVLVAAGGLSATLLGTGLEARREELRRSLPVRRVTEPSDVAALAVHLMVNPVLTGATYDIDGGQQLL